MPDLDLEVDEEAMYLLVIETTETTRLIRAKLVYNGGMVEFRDALTDKFAGSCGRHWFARNARIAARFRDKLVVSLPPWPSVEARYEEEFLLRD